MTLHPAVCCSSNDECLHASQVVSLYLSHSNTGNRHISPSYFKMLEACQIIIKGMCCLLWANDGARHQDALDH